MKEGGTKSQNFWKLRKRVLPAKGQTTYNTKTEDGIEIIGEDETKEHIANYYENLYQAREGKPEYQNWTDTIKNKIKQLAEQTK